MEWQGSGWQASGFGSMASRRERSRAWITLWVSGGQNRSSGTFRLAPFAKWMAKAVAMPVDDEFAGARWTVRAFILGRKMFGPIRGEWQMSNGKDGGARTRPIVRRPLCLRTIRARRSRWTVVRPSTSLPPASKPRTGVRGKQWEQDIKIGGGVETVSNISAQAMSTRFIWRWRRGAWSGRVAV